MKAPPPRLTSEELDEAEEMAELTLARCARVDAGRTNITKPHNGSVLPPMANAILSLVAEVRERRAKIR